jgi:hypothetical protein
VIKRTTIADETTGEVHSTKVQYISAAFHEEKGYLFWARKGFAKSFQDVPYPREMTFEEIGRVAVLAKHIWSNTNMLGYRGNGGVKSYNVEQIGGLIGLKRRQAYNFVNKMLRLGILAKVNIKMEGKTETQYYINPIYFFASNHIPLNLYLIFRRQLDAVLPDWVKQQFVETAKRQKQSEDQ